MIFSVLTPSSLRGLIILVYQYISFFFISFPFSFSIPFLLSPHCYGTTLLLPHNPHPSEFCPCKVKKLQSATFFLSLTPANQSPFKPLALCQSVDLTNCLVCFSLRPFVNVHWPLRIESRWLIFAPVVLFPPGGVRCLTACVNLRSNLGFVYLVLFYSVCYRDSHVCLYSCTIPIISRRIIFLVSISFHLCPQPIPNCFFWVWLPRDTSISQGCHAISMTLDYDPCELNIRCGVIDSILRRILCKLFLVWCTHVKLSSSDFPFLL